MRRRSSAGAGSASTSRTSPSRSSSGGCARRSPASASRRWACRRTWRPRDLAARDKHEFEKWAITLIPDAQPFRGGRKGADTGIDGVLYLKTGRTQSARAILSVKGGRNVGVGMVRDLISVVEREKALIGLFLTLAPPTREMEREAVAAGFVETDLGRFPKIQILTVEGLMTGTEHPRLPVVDSTAFKRARREETSTQGELGI
jgi:site-specific DNA-methyltransferase (adenine-specific)